MCNNLYIVIIGKLKNHKNQSNYLLVNWYNIHTAKLERFIFGSSQMWYPRYGDLLKFLISVYGKS